MRVPTLTLIYDRRKVANKKTLGTVELRICAERKRKYISTGVRVFPQEWSNGEVTAQCEHYKEYNEILHTLKTRTIDIIERMVKQGNFDLDAVPKMLDEATTSKATFLEYAQERAEQKYLSVSAGTRKRYEVVFRFLEEWGGIIHFADVTEKNIRRMDEELQRRGLQECSIYNYHKVLKVFTKQAAIDDLIPKNPYDIVSVKRGEDKGLTRFLTPEEFHRFETCEIEDECLSRVRDLFVFQTYTMMAYSDLEAFQWKKCTKSCGQIVYKSKRIKTAQEFVVVLLPQALGILKKYKNHLPIICNQDYNRYLKAAVKYAKINKAVTTHWARHTGATLMVNDGLPMEIVQHILGHASIRETERTYAKVLDRTIVQQMASYGIKKGRV